MGLVVLEMLLFLVKVVQSTGVVAATGLRAVVARRIVSVPTFVITVFFIFHRLIKSWQSFCRLSKKRFKL